MNHNANATLQHDNDKVRITEYVFRPGAETGMHIHEMDYVVIPLTSGQLRMVDQDGNEHLAELKLGVSYFREKGVQHNVININDHDFTFIEIEMKA